MTEYNISDAELPTMVVRYDNKLILRSVITGQHLRVVGTAPSWLDPPVPEALRLQRQQIERQYNAALEAFVNLLPLAEAPKKPSPPPPTPQPPPCAPVISKCAKSPVSQYAELPPCKVQRNYCCSLCSYYTQNPRSHLLHQRDVHGIRLSIHSCQHCQYASRYFQKLKRHIKMVHTIDPIPEARATDNSTVSATSSDVDCSYIKDSTSPPATNEVGFDFEKDKETFFKTLKILPKRSENQRPTNIPTSSKKPWPIALNPPKTAEDSPFPKPIEAPSISDKPSSIQKDPEAFFVAAYRNQLQKQYVHEQRVKQFVNAYREQQDNNKELELPPATCPLNESPFTTKAPPRTPIKETTTKVTKLLTVPKEVEKERMFSCRKCNYVTHIKSRYNKHVKYHSMPMIQCDKCEFRTTYKWNLTRHLRSHRDNGIYKCSVCTFSAHMKQSLTSHEMNHHSPPIGCADGSTPMRRRRCRVGGSDLHETLSKVENKKNIDLKDDETEVEKNKQIEGNDEKVDIAADVKKEIDATENMDIDTSSTERSGKNDDLTDSEVFSSSEAEMDVDDSATTSIPPTVPDTVLSPVPNTSLNLKTTTVTEGTTKEISDQFSVSTSSITDSSDTESMDEETENPAAMESLPFIEPLVIDYNPPSKTNSTTDNASECSLQSNASKSLHNNFHIAYDSNSQSSSDRDSSDESSDTSTESSSESSDSFKMESAENNNERKSTPIDFF